MKTTLTRADRQKIIDEFTGRHDGRYDPKAFLSEVSATNGQHQAWGWFTWDDKTASEKQRVWEARKFAGGLVVSFTVETIVRGNVTVRHEEVPAMWSPMDNWRSGGGYEALDPDDPVQMAAFCAEAARSLQSWLRRYGGAVAYAGGSVVGIRRQASLLDSMTAAKEADAA